MKDATNTWALEVEDLTVAYAEQPVLYAWVKKSILMSRLVDFC